MREKERGGRDREKRRIVTNKQRNGDRQRNSKKTSEIPHTT